jgi:hypothetical protein
MHRRLIAVLGAASGATLAAWLVARRRSRSLANDIPATIAASSGLLTTFEVDDDRAAEIIAQFAPAVQTAVHEQTNAV